MKITNIVSIIDTLARGALLFLIGLWLGDAYADFIHGSWVIFLVFVGMLVMPLVRILVWYYRSLDNRSGRAE